MKLKAIKKKLAAHEWYRQGGAAKLWYISYPLRACFEFTVNHRPIPAFYKDAISCVLEDYFNYFLPIKTVQRVAQYYLCRQHKDGDFIESLKTSWEQSDVQDLLTLVKKIENAELQALSDTQMLKLHREFSNIYMRLWREAIFHDAFDVMGDVLLEKYLNKEKRQVSDADLHILTTITEPSCLQKEKASLIRIADSARRSKKLVQLIKRKTTAKRIAQEFPRFYQRLKRHASTYHWIQNDFAVTKRLDTDFFLSGVWKLLTDQKFYQSEKENIALPGKTRKERANLMRQLKLSRECSDLLNLLTTVAAWRDWRKAMNQVANSALALFAREFVRRLDAPQQTIEYVLWWEVPRLFNTSKKEQRVLLQLAERREKGSLYLDLAAWKDSRCALFGKDAREVNEYLNQLITEQHKELKGRTAFPGLVKGTAKVINNQSDFAKMKQGDILIASNTRPEYVPIMRIAGAIVTEEGGITSHAAVVSREMQKPCIVGVQGLLNVIQDGDRVEVDANTGVVRKL